MAGVVTPFLEVANRVTSVAVIAQQRPLARLRFEPDGTPYSFVAMIPQDVTEKILVGELRRKGGAVEYDTIFVSAVEHDGYISATLDRKGERLEVTALFLVGCDGAHSAVRHLLNLSFDGAQYDASFMLADVDTNEVLPGDELHLCPSQFGPLAIFPMSATRRRLVATVDKTEEDAPSLEFVRMVVAHRAPAGL
jgi:2-polyprenyl-6-methoxyphenol hydroxylase-like FAD-dependent oxidoreductase